MELLLILTYAAICVAIFNRWSAVSRSAVWMSCLQSACPKPRLGCEIYSPYPSLSVRVDTQRLLQRLAISALRLDRYASQLQATVCKTLTS
jgi:hypothetical protein